MYGADSCLQSYENRFFSFVWQHYSDHGKRIESKTIVTVSAVTCLLCGVFAFMWMHAFFGKCIPFRAGHECTCDDAFDDSRLTDKMKWCTRKNRFGACFCYRMAKNGPIRWADGENDFSAEIDVGGLKTTADGKKTFRRKIVINRVHRLCSIENAPHALQIPRANNRMENLDVCFFRCSCR